MRSAIGISAVLLCFMLGGLCGAIASADDTLHRFGIVEIHSSSSACAIFKGKALTPGQNIHAVFIDSHKWVEGKVIQVRSTRCREYALSDGIVYDVQLKGADFAGWDVGVAVIASQATISVRGADVILSDAGNSPIVLKNCTSSEGVHFLARQDEKLLWHEYYYVGYDTEPTCAEEDLK